MGGRVDIRPAQAPRGRFAHGDLGEVPMDLAATPIDISTVRTDRGTGAGRFRRFAAIRAHDALGLHGHVRDALERDRREHAVVADRSGTIGGAIAAIIVRAGEHPIHRLTISLPGSRDGRVVRLHWGAEVVRADNLDLHAERFERLGGHFAPDGLVTLHVGGAGEDRELLTGLAELVGVPVQGPLGQLPATRWIARFARCFPDGRTPEVHLDIH
jgi:hypothetical protein